MSTSSIGPELKNPEDAMDIAQESFIKVHRYIGNFQGSSSFYTWLYRIAIRNLISNKDDKITELYELLMDAIDALQSFDWPGNVRQLENLCRWLTVMASGQEIHVEDLPPELSRQEGGEQSGGDWRNALKTWARRQLQTGRQNLLDEATPAFETIMIETALEQTGGRRQDAAKLLGWGRNTLSRKIKELHLGMEQGGDGVHT